MTGAAGETVPLVDLAAAHARVADAVAAGWSDVLAGRSFILGPPVEAFEREYAAFHEVPHCLGVASGTDALELALRSVGIGPGDEVVVPANTFVATAMAAVRAGATPVFADVAPGTLLVDASTVSAVLTERTRAILPVHLYGQMAPMQELLDLAAARGLAVIEDACQAHGARQGGRPAGTFGVAAAVSFYPGKNLGAYGDAGAVLTTADDIAWRVAALRNYGSTTKYVHDTVGFNSRLDTLQAVVLRAKLVHLEAGNEARRAAAARYSQLLAGLAVELPTTAAGNLHAWHLYVVRVPGRDEVLARMRERGIECGAHYPVAAHLQKAFAASGLGPGDLPVAEAAAAEVLSLPMFPEITVAQQERVASALGDVLG